MSTRKDQINIYENYYIILGVKKSASTKEISHAYRMLARAHHPDKVGNANLENIIKIQLAYQILKDPFTRNYYDESFIDLKRAFWEAAVNGDIEAIKNLINLGMDINIKFNDKNILHLLAQKNLASSIIVDLIVDLGINLNEVCSAGLSIIDYALLNYNNKMVTHLLAFGAINPKNIVFQNYLVKQYIADPLKFILENHKISHKASQAINKLKVHKELDFLDRQFYRTLKCLENKITQDGLEKHYDNLNQLCGEEATQTWYDPILDFFHL